MHRVSAEYRVIFEGAAYDAASLLAALHNGTQAVGLGHLHAQIEPMTRAQAAAILEQQQWRFEFDYVCGRPIKVRAVEDVIDELSMRLYDRDAGEGAFRRALAKAGSVP
jgi:hypothetical protein